MSIITNNISREHLLSLNEVKAGETGYGLLIERDNHMLSDCDIVRQIHEDIEHHHKFVIPDEFIVPAVFQKFDIKNANGRIYPEAILKREVQKYIEQRVPKLSYGALDHPNCQLADTKILTEDGWKQITEVKVGDRILTLNKDKKIEIHPVLRKIEQPYKGKIINLKGRMIDLQVTPNHKFPIFDRNKNFKGFYTAQDIEEQNIPDFSHNYLYKNGEWEGRNDEYFVLGRLTDEELSTIYRKDLKEKYSEDIKIPMDVWAKFMGIYLSEGDSNFRRTADGGRVNIHQKKQECIDEIKVMLDEFPLEYKIYDNTRGHVSFTIYDMRLAKYLEQFGNCYTKFVPFDLKQQNKETLRTFYDWFVLGDGRKRGLGINKYVTDDCFSTSERLALDLNEIQLKIGYNGSFHMEKRDNDRMIEGRLIEGKNCHPMYFTFRSLTNGIVLNDKSLKVTEEDYDGMVYCVEVENHNFYTMGRDGHCLWSGNSSSLSGHDVTHRILNLEWQGHTLIGEMILNVTEGFRKYGICSTSGDEAAQLIVNGGMIGVSSRAVGSVEERYGALIVGDDLELVSWDVVLEPSTPNAYIGMTRADLEPFIESKEMKDKAALNEKINAINKIILG